MSSRPKCPKCKRRLSLDDECDYENHETCLAFGLDKTHWDEGARLSLQKPFQCSRCDDAELWDGIYRAIAKEHETTVPEVKRLAERGREYARRRSR